MVVNKLDLSSLQDDGDTLELGDGRTLRLRIEADDIDPFEEADSYGKIGWDEINSDTGRRMRPKGFNGNAERISLLRGTVWWQPPSDGPKRGTEDFAKFRKLVLQLATYGACGVVLELLDDDSDQLKVASLWGIDSLADGYLAHVVSELADELGIEKG